MARTPLRNIRIDASTWERWQAIAVDRDQPVTGLIRESVEAFVMGLGHPGPPQNGVHVHVPPRSSRAVRCVHGNAPDSFCSRGCD